jgi:hypothetical protein
MNSQSRFMYRLRHSLGTIQHAWKYFCIRKNNVLIIIIIKPIFINEFRCILIALLHCLMLDLYDYLGIKFYANVQEKCCIRKMFAISSNSRIPGIPLWIISEGSIPTETFVSIRALKVLKARSARAPANESREIAAYVIARYCKAIKRGNESKWWTYHCGSKHSAEGSRLEMQNSCPKIRKEALDLS